MAYEKTTWNEGIAPGISAENLNKLETQYEEVVKLFNAHSILMAIADNDPAALEIAASRILGRKATGNIGALTGAEIMAILTGQAGADFSMNTHKITAVTDPTGDQDADTKKARATAVSDEATARDAAIAVRVPSGLIVMWHGTIGNIPAGWVICDGNNSTPNLLAKFIEGVATAGTNPGTTGGATAKTTAGHTTPSHVLTESEMPAHTHTYTRYEHPLETAPATGSTLHDRWSDTDSQNTGSKGGGGGHTHGSRTDSITDIRPKYYDIAYLMKT